MNTNHVDISCSSKTDSLSKIETKQSIKQREETKPSPRWGWSDGLYLLLFLLLTVAMAIRYTPQISGQVAGEYWDPLLNMWTMSWDTTTLLHNPGGLWQAPLLYPNSLTLSYSENLLGETIFYAPIYLLTSNPVLSYNIVFYLTYFLCAVSMYIMAQHYTGKPLAAFVAGLIYAFSPYRIGQIDHIHVIAGQWMPLAFLYLDRSLSRSTWRHWILFVVFYLLQLLSSIYYAIFLSYSLLAFVLFCYSIPFFRHLRQERSAYLKTLVQQALKPIVVLGVMSLILGTLMFPYLMSLSRGLGRLLEQSATFSAYIRDFLFAAPYNWLYGVSTYNGVKLPNDSEHYLFLGWCTIALAVLGAFLALRRRVPVLRAYIWVGLTVFLFSFGPFLQYSTTSGAPWMAQPYKTPVDAPAWPMPWFIGYFVLPGLKGLRAPARLTGVLLIVLALLAAYAIAWIIRERNTASHQSTTNTSRRFTLARLKQARFLKPALSVVLVLLPLVILLETVPSSLPVTQVPSGKDIPAVYQWLATHGGNDPIVELPMAHLDEDFTTKQEAWYDYYAIYHPHPIMNGWSGYRPPSTVTIAGVLRDFPSKASLDILRQHKIRYVVLHLASYPPDIAQALLTRVEANQELERVAVFGADSVWQVK